MSVGCTVSARVSLARVSTGRTVAIQSMCWRRARSRVALRWRRIDEDGQDLAPFQAATPVRGAPEMHRRLGARRLPPLHARLTGAQCVPSYRGPRVGSAWLRTSAVAFAVLSGIAVVCFAFQAAALGRPSRSETLVVRVIAELNRYRGSTARMTVNGRLLTAVCTDRWGKRGHVETVLLDNGVRLVRRGNKLEQRGARALDEFELAGCPRSLTGWLATQVNQGAYIQSSAAKIRGRRVYAIRVPAAKIGLELFVSRRGMLPVELAISGNGIHGTSELDYRNAPPALDAPFSVSELEALGRREPGVGCAPSAPVCADDLVQGLGRMRYRLRR